MNLLVLKLPPCMCAKSFQLCPTLCNPMDQALPSMGFSRQEYWSRLPCSPPGDLPNPGIKPMSPALPGKPLKLAKLSHFSRVRLCATP